MGEGTYRQSATFTEASMLTPWYGGQPIPTGRVDWSSHNRPDHASPHIHGYYYERGDRGTLFEGGPQGFSLP
jgi:hypothetical protein